GGDATPYQHLIDELGISERVKLIGSVEDIPQFLGTLDVAVLPSRAEGQSNALLEYMAAGRPIVATDVGGNPMLLGAAAEQACIAAEDVSALAGRVLHILNNPQPARELGEMLRLGV